MASVRLAPAQTTDPAARAARLFGRELPALVRALTPARLHFDRSRRARRLTRPPARWARPPEGFPPAHRHPRSELCFGLAGRCPFLLGEERFTIRRGDLVVLSPEVFHREFAAEQGAPYKLVWMSCHPQGAGAFVQEHLGGGRFSQRAMRLWVSDFSVGLKTLEAVDVELYEDRPGAFLRAQGLLLQLCGHFLRALSERRGRAPKRGAGNEEALQRWRVKAAAEYVRDHYAQPLDLAEVGQYVGVSPGYLSALFSRALGHSFTAFLTGCRLEEARRLLADRSLSIKEIARRIGIPNPFYFSRLFHKHAGCAPREFRRQLY